MSLLSALSLSRQTSLGFATIGVVWGTVAALVPVLKAGIGAGDALFGAMLLASATGLATAMWLAPLADRRLGRFGLPCGAVLLALGIPVLGLAPNVLFYALVMLWLGTMSGLTDVLSNARVSEIEARTGRSLMNFNHAMFSVFYAMAAVLAGLGREMGLHPSLILCLPAAVCLVLAPMMRLLPEAAESDTAPEAGGMPMLLVALCGLIVLVAFGAEAAIESWSALHIERTLAGRAAEGALGPAMLGLTMAAGRLAGQVAADRLSDWSVLRGASLVTAAGVAIAALAPSPPVAYSGFALAGLGVSVIGPIGIALAGRLVPPRFRTQAIARAAVLGFSGFFVAPVVMGFVSEWAGLRMAFGTVVIFALLVLPLVAGVRAIHARRSVAVPAAPAP